MLFVLSEPVGQIVSFDPCMKVQQHDRKYQKITPQIVRRDREFLHGFRPEKNFPVFWVHGNMEGGILKIAWPEAP